MCDERSLETLPINFPTFPINSLNDSFPSKSRSLWEKNSSTSFLKVKLCRRRAVLEKYDKFDCFYAELKRDGNLHRGVAPGTIQNSMPFFLSLKVKNAYFWQQIWWNLCDATILILVGLVKQTTDLLTMDMYPRKKGNRGFIFAKMEKWKIWNSDLSVSKFTSLVRLSSSESRAFL